jgi:hypothetical protein
MLKVLPRNKRPCNIRSVQHGHWYGLQAAYSTVNTAIFAPLTPWDVGVDQGRWFANRVRSDFASCRIGWEDEC